MDDVIEGQNNEPEEVVDEPVEELPASEQDESTEEEAELPEDIKERTRGEFDKLKERNKAMSERLKKYEKTEAKNALEDVLGNQAPPVPQQAPQGAPQVNDYIDNQGNVDVGGLNQALNRANVTAEHAARLAEQVNQMSIQRDMEYQVREAHNKHPWLDPESDNFDEDAYELVKDRLVRYRAEHKPARFVDVADFVNDRFREKPEEKPAVSAKKAQSSSAQRGKGRSRPATKVNVDELRQRAADGDLKAVDKLIELAT